MQLIRNLIDEGNWLGLLFVAAAMGYIGDAIVRSRPKVKLWGVRIAVTTFLLFSVTRAVEFGEPVTADLVAAVFHGVLAAALVIGPAWITLACIGYLYSRYETFCQFLRSHISRARSSRRDRHQNHERARQESRRVAREAVERRRAGDDHQRRRNARAKALRAFHLLKSDLGDRFTDKEFTNYVQSHLADNQTPEDVEHHATKLIQLLKQLAESKGNATHSSGALNQRFEQQRAAIAAAPIDDELRDILATELEEQYEEEFRRLIREKKQ